MPTTFAEAKTWIGWLVAFVTLVFAAVFGFMGLLPKEWVMVIAAICAIRL